MKNCRNCLIMVVAFLSCSMQAATARGEETAAQVSSPVPEGARYSVVQSQLAARWTFKLDKQTGDSFQLMENERHEPTWKLLPRQTHPGDKLLPGQVNYQIVISGLSATQIVLLNVNSGASWLLRETSNGNAWVAFE